MVRLLHFAILLLCSAINPCTSQCTENVTMDLITRRIKQIVGIIIESPTTPRISILEVYYNCRAHAPVLNLFSSLSVTVEYLVSNPDPLTMEYTQLDFECTNNAWVDASQQSPPVFNTSQPAVFRSHSYYRDNCTQCHFSASNPYHCVECAEICGMSNFGYCTSAGASECCNFVWHNTCQVACPERTQSDLNHSCVCSEFHSGSNCDVCNYPCDNNGTANAECNACVCAQGYTDRNCSAEIDFCASSPCPRNADCSSSPAGATCTCIQGYTGANCDSEINYCISQPCKNNSVCVYNTTGFYCICHAGTTGHDCGVTVDSCSIQNPCQNNATCLNGIAGAECRCPHGYTGQFCDSEVNYCDTSPCMNNGSCTPVFGNYSCACHFPFSGHNCENVIDYCDPNPCSNNSVECVNTQSGSVCVCNPGFSGALCEENINECLLVDCNAGTCVDVVFNYTCECDVGFTGRHCELNDVDLLCNKVRCENNGSCSVEYFMNANRSEVELIVSRNDLSHKPGYCNCTNEWGGVMCESCLLSCGENEVSNSECSQCICEGLWSGVDCMECEYFREAETCVENCTIESYQVSSNGTCFACGIPHCVHCNQSRPQLCEECVFNYTLNPETGACDEVPIHSTTPSIITTSPQETPPPPPEIPPLDFPGLSLGLPLGLLLLLLLIVAIIIIVYLMCKFKGCGCCACCCKCGACGGGPSDSSWWGSQQKKTINIQIVSAGLDDDEDDVILRKGKKKKKKLSKDKVLDKYKHLEDSRASHFSTVAPTANQIPTQSHAIELNENPQYSPERQQELPSSGASEDFEFIYERQLASMQTFPTSTPLQPPPPQPAVPNYPPQQIPEVPTLPPIQLPQTIEPIAPNFNTQPILPVTRAPSLQTPIYAESVNAVYIQPILPNSNVAPQIDVTTSPYEQIDANTSQYQQMDDMYSYRDSFTSESIYVPPSLSQHYENVGISTEDYHTPEYSNISQQQDEYVNVSGWQTTDNFQDFTQASDSTFTQNASSRTPL